MKSICQIDFTCLQVWSHSTNIKDYSDNIHISTLLTSGAVVHRRTDLGIFQAVKETAEASYA